MSLRSGIRDAYRSIVPAQLRRRVDYLRYDVQTRHAVRLGDEQRALARKVRYELFLSIGHFARVNRPITGAYMEFGCFGGNTMRLAWRAFAHYGWHFYGFDSFEGLPEISEIDRQEIWAKGRLAMGEDEFRRIATSSGMPCSRLTTVKGFYSDSLTKDLAYKIQHKAAVIYIDCDLYSSTVEVLNWILPFLQPGTFVVFDDWDAFLADPEKGERRAWREFLQSNPTLRFEEYSYSVMAKSFVFVGAG